MKTHLLKSLLSFAFLLFIFCCSAQKQKIRVVYEYELHDSGVEKKEMKLIRVQKESYDEQKPYINNTLPSNINNKISFGKDQTIKDGKFSYQYSFERKSVSVKKIDNRNQNIISITNLYFGFNNRLSDEITVDEKTKHKETRRYLYDRQGRLAKIVSYNNGKVNGYTLYQYNDDNEVENNTNL